MIGRLEKEILFLKETVDQNEDKIKNYEYDND